MDPIVISTTIIMSAIIEMRLKLHRLGRRVNRVEQMAHYYEPTLVKKVTDETSGILPAIKLALVAGFCLLCFACGDVNLGRAPVVTGDKSPAKQPESPAAEVATITEYISSGVLVIASGCRVASFYPAAAALALGGLTGTIAIVAGATLLCALAFGWLVAHWIVFLVIGLGITALVAYRHRKHLLVALHTLAHRI